MTACGGKAAARQEKLGILGEALAESMYFSRQMAEENTRTEDWLSIGKLAEATGIGVDSLRVWEKRYGDPKSIRLPSGHRRYDPALIPRLRRVAEAIARGVRPSRLLGEVEGAEALLENSESQAVGGTLAKDLDEVLLEIRGGEGDKLRRRLRKLHARLGAASFIDDCVGPLFDRIGSLWAAGSLEVRHEHFGSEILEDLLRSLREEALRRRRRRKGVGELLLTSLPGERHGLGLLMVSLLAAEERIRSRLLGPDTPMDQIVRAASEGRVHALGLSISLASQGPATHRMLGDLRERVPQRVRMLIGGSGARGPRRPIPGILVLQSAKELAVWLRELGG